MTTCDNASVHTVTDDSSSRTSEADPKATVSKKLDGTIVMEIHEYGTTAKLDTGDGEITVTVTRCTAGLGQYFSYHLPPSHGFGATPFPPQTPFFPQTTAPHQSNNSSFLSTPTMSPAPAQQQTNNSFFSMPPQSSGPTFPSAPPSNQTGTFSSNGLPTLSGVPLRREPDAAILDYKAYNETSLSDWSRQGAKSLEDVRDRLGLEREISDWAHQFYHTSANNRMQGATDIATWMTDIFKGGQTADLSYISSEIADYIERQTPGRHLDRDMVTLSLRELANRLQDSWQSNAKAYDGSTLETWATKPKFKRKDQKHKVFDEDGALDRLKRQTIYDKWLDSNSHNGHSFGTLEPAQRSKLASWVVDRVDIKGQSHEFAHRDLIKGLKNDPSWNPTALDPVPTPKDPPLSTPTSGRWNWSDSGNSGEKPFNGGSTKAFGQLLEKLRLGKSQ